MAGLALDPLREAVRGQVIDPKDPEYNAARAVFNGMIDRKPGAVVRVAGVADVIACVTFARDNGIDLAVRGGGHSAPGFGTVDGGLVIDMVNRKGIRVDPQTKTVRAEGGCTWGDFNHATNAFGLATTGGIVSTTGIAGLTLGGGIGYLTRKCGLSCDNLISADVVLADGRYVTASEKENQDLFWALRGGSGNFGVVTSLEYKLYPIADVYGGPVIYPLEHGEAVARFYREYMADAPEEFGAFLGYHLGPPVPFLPEEWHGKPVVVVVGMWTGPMDEGEMRWKPFMDVAPVVGSHVGPMPYPALNAAFDPLLPPGMQNYWKASAMPKITDEVITIGQKFGQKVPSIQTAVHFYPIDGAVNRVGKDDTAFPHRDVKFQPVVAGMWDDPKQNDNNIKWVRDFWTALQPHSSAGGYINFMDADDQSRIQDNYSGTYAKLATVKKKYDPGNLFHMNQNIKPA
ncbi:MAG: FAD-binding oxidoreductase [Actinomycetota bacterium]